MTVTPDAAGAGPRPRAPWSWLADARGIGRPLVVALTALVGVDALVAFGQLGTTEEVVRDPRITATVGALSVVVFLAVLVVARWGWLGSDLARRHPSIMVATLLGAVLLAVPIAAAAGPVLAASALRASAPGEVVPTAPIVLGDVAGRGVLLFAGTATLLIVLGALNAHRDALASLRDARVTLEATLAASAADLASERARLRDRVRALVEVELGPRLERPDADLGPELRRLADTVVRPLSHEFARTASGFGPAATPPAVREPWRRAMRGLAVEPRLRPVVLALTLTVLGFGRSFAAPPSEEGTATSADVAPTGSAVDGSAPAVGVDVAVDWTSLGVSLTLLAATFVATLLLARVLDRRLAQRPADTRGGRWAIALVGLGALGAAVVGLARGLHAGLGRVVPDLGVLPPADAIVLAANVLPLWLATLAVGLAAGALDALARHRSELVEHNADLAITVVRTNALLAKQRRDFARALHGSVQAAVQAAGLRLDLAARDGALDAASVATATEPIRAALEALDPARERAAPDLAAELERTRATWLGVCDVGVQLDPIAAARLGTDALACSVALDLVREACANAVVHGSATRITIAIVPEGEREVLLRVVDDGTSTHPLRATGLGSEVLDTSTTRWHLERRAWGTELEAVLPLG